MLFIYLRVIWFDVVSVQINYYLSIYKFLASSSCVYSHLKANKLLLSVFQKLSVKRVYDEGSYLICHKHGANEFTIRKAALSPNNKL